MPAPLLLVSYYYQFPFVAIISLVDYNWSVLSYSSRGQKSEMFPWAEIKVLAGLVPSEV